MSAFLIATPGCGCTSACLIYRDTFSRLLLGGEWATDGTVGISTTWPGWAYIALGDGTLRWTNFHVPVRFSAKIDVWPTEPGQITRMNWQVVGDGGSEDGKRYR